MDAKHSDSVNVKVIAAILPTVDGWTDPTIIAKIESVQLCENNYAKNLFLFSRHCKNQEIHQFPSLLYDITFVVDTLEISVKS